MAEYRNLTCIGCGYSWNGRPKYPKCPQCGKSKVREKEVEIPEYRKPSTKIINDIEKLENEPVQDNQEDLETLETSAEVQEEFEEIEYTCAYCKSLLMKGQIYCSCGERILWDQLEENGI